tara:strand:- start:326 stop:901 length:576 start_codon:yes stop_codon:yes gene_type:complete
MDNIPILYINLECRRNRHKDIVNELKKYNLKGERVEAIKHENGYLGCVLSHIKCIDKAIKKNYDEVIILEDDFIFLQNPNKLNLNIDYDIFLLGGSIWNSKKEFNFIRILDASRTEGYIIKKHYYKILKECWIKSVSNLLREFDLKYCLDITWKVLQKKDKFYMNDFGLIGGQREGYSDIQLEIIKRINYS